MPTHDVLVIGAGLAGQRAALAAAEEGAAVGILSKVHPVRSHSNAAQGGINAALNPEDSWESHAYDTVKGSDYLGDQDAIEIMCREAPGEILALEQYHPATVAGNGLLITEGARGEGAHLYNAQGERFMEKYAPNKMELASRDVVSRAEQTEINEGRGFPDGTVALDITKVPRKRIHEALREIVNVGRDFAGVDITSEPIHIKPGNHYTMGGVKTDVDGRTDIPGLYAAGEVACVSVHGGNRLGANSLHDTLVFGSRSGKHAAEHARNHKLPELSHAILDDEERGIREIVGRDNGNGRRVAQIRE